MSCHELGGSEDKLLQNPQQDKNKNKNKNNNNNNNNNKTKTTTTKVFYSADARTNPHLWEQYWKRIY